jgi:hypothetical protein
MLLLFKYRQLYFHFFKTIKFDGNFWQAFIIQYVTPKMTLLNTILHNKLIWLHKSYICFKATTFHSNSYKEPESTSVSAVWKTKSQTLVRIHCVQFLQLALSLSKQWIINCENGYWSWYFKWIMSRILLILTHYYSKFMEIEHSFLQDNMT